MRWTTGKVLTLVVIAWTVLSLSAMMYMFNYSNNKIQGLAEIEHDIKIN